MNRLKVADRWFERTTHDNGITQLVEPHLSRVIRCNVWHVRGRDRDLVVDTGVGVASVSAELADLLDRPVTCVATHFHFDHVGCFHEFDTRLMHAIDGALMDPYQGALPLTVAELDDPAILEALDSVGYHIDGDALLDALPAADFNPVGFKTLAALPTGTVQEGDVIDLGDRHFEVLHLPGHTQGSIGLWEGDSATLFAGDTVYDGPLIDFLPESDIAAYLRTMKRLHDMPADTVHAGHDPSFGRDRLRELTSAYLAKHA
jgi:glyoxylase-like metal-dependent hydrolase (beta-lactamase superfamily II)